jgi:hypothetical protein
MVYLLKRDGPWEQIYPAAGAIDRSTMTPDVSPAAGTDSAAFSWKLWKRH